MYNAGTMIVTEEFLSACMDAGKKVDEGPYLLSKVCSSYFP